MRTCSQSQTLEVHIQCLMVQFAVPAAATTISSIAHFSVLVTCLRSVKIILSAAMWATWKTLSPASAGISSRRYSVFTCWKERRALDEYLISRRTRLGS